MTNNINKNTYLNIYMATSTQRAISLDYIGPSVEIWDYQSETKGSDL